VSGSSLDQGIGAGFLQGEVNLRRSQRFVAGGPVQCFQYRDRDRDRRRFADHPELMAAIVDFHAQPAFDLAQVFVQMPTQIGQPRVVGGFQQ
jgi:hypothetical protein